MTSRLRGTYAVITMTSWQIFPFIQSRWSTLKDRVAGNTVVCTPNSFAMQLVEFVLVAGGYCEAKRTKASLSNLKCCVHLKIRKFGKRDSNSPFVQHLM